MNAGCGHQLARGCVQNDDNVHAPTSIAKLFINDRLWTYNMRIRVRYVVQKNESGELSHVVIWYLTLPKSQKVAYRSPYFYLYSSRALLYVLYILIVFSFAFENKIYSPSFSRFIGPI